MMKTLWKENKNQLMKKYEKILGQISPQLKEILELYDIDELRNDIDNYIRYKIIQTENNKAQLKKYCETTIDGFKYNHGMTILDLKIALGKWIEINEDKVKDYILLGENN